MAFGDMVEKSHDDNEFSDRSLVCHPALSDLYPAGGNLTSLHHPEQGVVGFLAALVMTRGYS
jgi:hypothetical protein